jgi:hypothetical protein
LLDDFGGGVRGHVDQAAAGFGEATAADICFSSPHSDIDFFLLLQLGKSQRVKVHWEHCLCFLKCYLMLFQQTVSFSDIVEAVSWDGL